VNAADLQALARMLGEQRTAGAPKRTRGVTEEEMLAALLAEQNASALPQSMPYGPEGYESAMPQMQPSMVPMGGEGDEVERLLTMLQQDDTAMGVADEGGALPVDDMETERLLEALRLLGLLNPQAR
jgi:hypothetical protein